MAARQRDGLSQYTPLLVEENQHEENAANGFGDDNNSKGQASFFKTCFHGVNAISGIGIISIPYAVALGGWLSLVLLFMIAIAAYYSSILIKKSMDLNSNIKTFPDLGQQAFGKRGKEFVLIAMNCEIFLALIGYLIVEGDNLNKIIPNVELNIAGITISGTQLFIIIAALIILPTVWFDNLIYLSYVSSTGALASVIFLCALFWNGAFDGTGFNQKGTLINWSGIPSALSLYAFCYSSHSVFPNLYTSMTSKNQFSNVMLVCFTLCTFIYAATAILGYLMFGSGVESEITLNLSSDKVSSKVAIYITLVNPIAKFALFLTPITDSIKGVLPNHYNGWITHVVVSTSLLISTIIVAMLAVPFFGYVMALLGALGSMLTAIVIPYVCYLKISGTYGIMKVETIINWATVVMGVAVAIAGTYSALVGIIEAY